MHCTESFALLYGGLVLPIPWARVGYPEVGCSAGGAWTAHRALKSGSVSRQIDEPSRCAFLPGSGGIAGKQVITPPDARPWKTGKGAGAETVKLHRCNVMRQMETLSIGDLVRAWETLPANARPARPRHHDTRPPAMSARTLGDRQSHACCYSAAAYLRTAGSLRGLFFFSISKSSLSQ
jgi:hypothetical protein